jgi:hypothetical protein
MTMNVDDVVLTCCHKDCGISFAVPSWWHKGKRETHTWFYCPNGHQQHFSSESDIEKARRERDIARQQVARAEQEAAEARRGWEKAEREAKKLKKRASAGTCPCCQRTFSNMATHMKREHPQFVADGGAKVVPIKVAAR